MTKLDQIVNKAVEDGLMELSPDGSMVRLTEAGKKYVEATKEWPEEIESNEDSQM